MVDNFALFVIIVFSVIIQHSNVEGRSCFLCASKDETMDSCKKDGVICPLGIHVCLKTIAKFDFNKTVSVLRSCAISNEKKDGCSSFDNVGADYRICFCSEDDCNSSGILRGLTITFLISFLLTNFMAFMI